MSQDDIDASKAPLIDHLIELRGRLIKSLIAIAIAFVVCFYFASDIFNILVVPYERAAGATKTIELIYTAPQEFFFTQLKLALFGALFLAFPVLAVQIYMFVAPGLYRNEREGLRTKRKYAIVIAFILAAVLTPPDPISQISLAVPAMLLYEISIIAVRYVERSRAARVAEAAEAEKADEAE